MFQTFPNYSIYRITLIALILSGGFCLSAQNLVPNASFEVKKECPKSDGDITMVNEWWAPFGKPVYFHKCNNYQTAYRRMVPPGQQPYNVIPVEAFDGQGYVGIYMSDVKRKGLQDYLMCQLNKSLIKDSIYKVEMMVRLGNVWKYADYIGAYFSKDKYAITSKQRIKYNYPGAYAYELKNRVSLIFDKDTVRLSNGSRKLNDRNNWIKISGEYKANGGERFITIGNYSLGANSICRNNIAPKEEVYIEDGKSYLKGGFFYSGYVNTFYYIDNVSVTPIPINKTKAYRQFASTIQTGEAIELDNIYFDIGSTKLKPESNATLQLLLTYLQQNSKLTLSVEGHIDNVGNAALNQRLSEGRAQAIVSYLITNGIKKGRMTAAGYGCLKPITTNSTVEGRDQNRRVEFT